MMNVNALIAGMDLEGAANYAERVITALEQARRVGSLENENLSLTEGRDYQAAEAVIEAVVEYVSVYDQGLLRVIGEAGRKASKRGLAGVAGAGLGGQALMTATAAMALGDLLGERYRELLLAPLAEMALIEEVDQEIAV
jgi:hypothetical protein